MALKEHQCPPEDVGDLDASKQVTMKAYSKVIRGEVLAASGDGGATSRVALCFRVSESWVRRIKQQRRFGD